MEVTWPVLTEGVSVSDYRVKDSANAKSVSKDKRGMGLFSFTNIHMCYSTVLMSSELLPILPI